MPNKFNLSETEMEIMELLWSKKEPIAFREILDYFNNERGKEWKKQTLRTLLVRLIDKGVLLAEARGSKYFYYPSKTKEGLVQSWTQNLVKNMFDGSIANFLVALTGGNKLDKKSIEELKKFLDQ